MGKKEIWLGNRKKYTSKNPILNFIVKKFNQDIAKLAASCKPKNILDVGCGEGFITTVIADSLPNVKITAIDKEKEYVEYAKEKNFRTNIIYARKDLFNLSFSNSMFDLVMCNEVLEHLKNYEEALNILTKVSKRFILISVPNEPWFRIANMLRLKYLTGLGNVPGHLHSWSKRGIKELCSAYGKIIATQTSTFWNIVLLDKNR